IERVSKQTGSQVRKLRHQVHLLRESQPQAAQLAENMKAQLKYLGEYVQHQGVDYESLRAVHDAFGEAARTLDELSADRGAPVGLAQIGLALGATADVLDFVQARDVARLVRAGGKGVDDLLSRTPEARQNLRNSAALLRETKKHLRDVIDNRPAYEQSLRNTHKILDGFSAAVPMYTHQWGKDLADQERSLTNLGQSIDEVTAVMPEIKSSGARLMVMTRLLLSLLGAIFLLHGGYLAVHLWMGQTVVGRGSE